MKDRRSAAHDGKGARAARGPLRRDLATFVATLTAVIAVVVVTSGIAASATTPRVCSAGEEQMLPLSITAGPDGNVWFIEMAKLSCIGRMTPTGVVTEFPASLGDIPGIPGGSLELADITAGPDGNLWFLAFEGPDGNIGRMTPQGVVTRFRYRTGNPYTQQYAITAGPDGNLWFTTNTAGILEPPGVGRISPAGVVTLFPFESFAPDAITAGPDGNLWATGGTGRSLSPRIGRISPQGALTVFRAGRGGGYLRGITAGPDGNLWFIERRSAEQEVSWIGRITPQGRVTMFKSGVEAGSGIDSITAGPDGNVWFTVFGGDPVGDDRIGRITPQGAVTLFRAGITPYAGLDDITAGSDGNLWFTEANGRRIGRITPTGLVSEFPPIPAIGMVRRRGTSAVMVRLRCPPGAAWDCRGTVTLALTASYPRDRVGVGSFEVAPGQQTTVAVPLWAAGQRRLKSDRRLPLEIKVRPRWHSPGGLGGSVVHYVVLRLPRLPAVTG